MPPPPRSHVHHENDALDDVNCAHAPGLYPGHPLVHFDAPTAAGRQIFSIQCSLEKNCTASSAQPLQGADVSSSLTDVHDATTLEESPMASTSSSYTQDNFWVRIFNDWGIRFYIRIDRRGCFHTYPHVGGPFHSLPEADGAIDCYLRDREDPTMRIDPDDPDLIYHVQESTRERAIRRNLCWPDGTRKERLQSLPIDERRCWMLQLVQALVDKYNDDHNLLGDLAYGLKDVVRYHVFNEGNNNRRMYYHINFTAKTEDCDNLLFFAEAIGEQRDELMVSCICRVNPFDKDRGCCYGCSSKVKHPKDDAYAGGHSSAGCMSGTYHSYGPLEDLGVTPAELEAEEANVRHSYKDPVDPSFVESLKAPRQVDFNISNKPPRPLEESVAFISRWF